MSITSVTPLWRQYPCKRLKRANAMTLNKISMGTQPKSKIGWGIRKSNRSNHAITTEAAISIQWNNATAQSRCLTGIEYVRRNLFDMIVSRIYLWLVDEGLVVGGLVVSDAERL